MTIFHFHLKSKEPAKKIQNNDLDSVFHQIIDRLTAHSDYEVLIGNQKIKLERTLTEIGICDTFNSELTPFFTPRFYLNEKDQKDENNLSTFFKMDYFNADAFAIINDLKPSQVINSICCRQS